MLYEGRSNKGNSTLSIMELDQLRDGQCGSFNPPQITPKLPPELCAAVFRHLSPTGFLAVINACPHWRQLMMAETTTALFPQIILILTEYLDSRTILNCRGVTKEAKRVTDDLLKECFGSWGKNQPVTTKLLLQQEIMRVRRYTFDSGTSYKKFKLYMRQRPFPDENPFITGSIRINLWWQIPYCLQTKRVECVDSFSSKCGKHVRSLVLLDATYDSTVRTLKLILPYFPNLESLKLESGFYIGLKENLSFLDLPSLHGLKELYLDPKCAISKTEIELALKLLNNYKWSLETVSVGGCFLESKYATIKEIFNNMPFIKHLHVQDINPIGLQKLDGAVWQLEELQLAKSINFNENFEAIHSLLKAIVSFATTLETLKLVPWRRDYFANRLDAFQMGLLQGEMKTMWVLKRITVDVGCLGLDWFAKFLDVSCKELQELTVILNNENTLPRVDMLMVQKAFEKLPHLKKVILLTKNNKKRTLHRDSAILTSM